jgi:hypothetical protein
MIFDVKLEDFCHNARFVGGGHTINTLDAVTYASVMSRESVRINLTLAALNVKVDDFDNSYLVDAITERVWTVLGP